MALKRPITGDKPYFPSYGRSSYQLTEEEFEALIDEHFAKYPTVERFGILAYTPHFNDGEPCVYRAWFDDDFGYRVESEGGGAAYEDEDGYQGPVRKDGTSWDTPMDEKYDFSQARWSFGPELPAETGIEDVCMANFGDHVYVLVTRDGYEVDYYEHD